MNADPETLFDDAEVQEVPSGAYLFHSGDPVRFVIFVGKGVVSLERVQKSGGVTCFQRAEGGDVLAEASLFSDTYHCDARVLEDATLRRIPKTDFRRNLDTSPRLATAWASHLARTVQLTRLSAEIRSFKTVGDRLDAWLDAFESLPPKGQWQSLAQELAVSREALYRELAKRRGKHSD